MNTKLKNTLLGSMVGIAFGMSAALTYCAQSADNDERQWIKIIDEAKIEPPRVALSIERNGKEVQSITIYDTDGKPSIVVHPDGNVDVLRGTPDEAARLFWHVVADNLANCNAKQ